MDCPKSSFVFFECSNVRCGLRFPLDTQIYGGTYCPRCGALLEKQEVGVPAHKPPSLPGPGFKLIGALDNIRSSHNVGSIFRAADGVGLSELILGGITPTPNEQPAIGKTALGAEATIKWSYHANLPEKLTHLKAANCLILALETTPEGQPLHEFRFNDIALSQVCLVVGSEPAGIDPAILRIADQVLYIPMSGEKTSLNVSVAFGIAIYDLSRL